MAGKGTVLANRRLTFAMDNQFSKNALIDLVVDRARAELGEDASDEDIAALVEQWARPVAFARNDRTVNLVPRLKFWSDKAAEYIRRHEPHKCARCPAIITSGDLCLECSRPGKWLKSRTIPPTTPNEGTP